MNLVRKLPDGPVDVIGDVHGEIDVLRRLLATLGYSPDGRHPQGRHLAFVGDLVDRGPDSIAVVHLVSALVRAGRASCVIGNHELNIMRLDRKEGNGWFFGQREQYPNGKCTTENLADDSVRAAVLEFFASLPLALARDDLRIVHACWRDAHVERAGAATTPLLAYSQGEVDRIEAELGAGGDVDEIMALKSKYPLDRRDAPPPMLSKVAALEVRRQNAHPIKVMTSGLETVASEPFWSGGRWRFEQRVAWWKDYTGPMVVIGHYWRTTTPKPGSLFAGEPPTRPLGRGHVMCVDYSIGRRARNQALGHETATALGAFRWPEGDLVLETG